MTIIKSTLKDKNISKHKTSFLNWKNYSFFSKKPVKDVIVVYENLFYDIDDHLNANDEMTKSCMVLSEPSFKEEWDNEDDDYWNSYL